MIDMSNREQVAAKLKELKAKNLPKATVEDFSKLNKSFNEAIKKASDEERAEIEKYLSTFYIDPEGHCLFTEEGPTLDWGLIHGEMFDIKTGLNWRAYHYLTIKGDRKRFETILQYHPDNYGIREEE